MNDEDDKFFLQILDMLGSDMMDEEKTIDEVMRLCIEKYRELEKHEINPKILEMMKYSFPEEFIS